jgi:hypothetical protein
MLTHRKACSLIMGSSLRCPGFCAASPRLTPEQNTNMVPVQHDMDQSRSRRVGQAVDKKGENL